MSAKIKAMNPMGYPPEIASLDMAPRQGGLGGKTLYLGLVADKQVQPPNLLTTNPTGKQHRQTQTEAVSELDERHAFEGDHVLRWGVISGAIPGKEVNNQIYPSHGVRVNILQILSNLEPLGHSGAFYPGCAKLPQIETPSKGIQQ